MIVDMNDQTRLLMMTSIWTHPATRPILERVTPRAHGPGGYKCRVNIPITAAAQLLDAMRHEARQPMDHRSRDILERDIKRLSKSLKVTVRPNSDSNSSNSQEKP